MCKNTIRQVFECYLVSSYTIINFFVVKVTWPNAFDWFCNKSSSRNKICHSSPRHFLILAICRLRKTKQVTIITLCLLPINMCNFIIIIKYFRWNQDTSNLRVYLILLNSSMIEPHLLRSVIVKYSCPNLSTWASNINLLLILHCYIFIFKPWILTSLVLM